MQILAISKLLKGATQDKIAQHGANEVKHTLEAYLDGKIRNFWFQTKKPGVVFILECTDEEEARQTMDEMPLVVAGLMDVDLIPLEPLKPLGVLIGRNFAP